jgi:hypothetical protein
MLQYPKDRQPTSVKVKSERPKLVGIFYNMDLYFIKIKYVCYVDSCLLGITKLEKKIEKIKMRYFFKNNV